MIDCIIQNPLGFSHVPKDESIQSWVDIALQERGMSSSIVVRFVDETEGKALNLAYRGKDYATNVLSFPYEEDDFGIPELANEQKHLGDLVLCQAVVEKEAVSQQKTHIQHWAHLIIHGVLHLQGYDHLTDSEANIMESLEIKLLDQLGFDNPYANDGLL